MGRLNYTNRKIEGLKLGQVVSKDLTKRIPPNAGYKSAFRDPGVELDVTGKALTDEGFFEVASAMVESLAYQSVQGRCARLEELCVKDNQLTIASLQALTPVVRLAFRDLRDLDLSNNMIAVNTEDEVAVWENFLMSFEQCCALRRIDWSGNPLGTRAFEVLLRVYAKERPIDLKPPAETEHTQAEVETQSIPFEQRGSNTRRASHAPDFDEDSDEERISNTHKRTGSRQDSISPAKANAMTARADALPSYATTQGLRSVPYLVLCDTSMTETCALHLSYIVENHHPTQQLLTRVPPAKAGISAQQLAAYDNDSECRGIVYHPNPGLGTTGVRVLELAEIRRKSHFHDKNGADLGSCLPGFQEPLLPSRTLDAGSHTTASRRRQSNHKGVLAQGEGSADLDRARSRIQGTTLQEAGLSSNELWCAALKLLVLGRDLQCPTKNHLPQTAPSKPALEAPKVAEKGPIIKTLTIPGYVKPPPIKPLPLPKTKDCARPPTLSSNFPPLKPLTGKDPNQSINSRGLPSRKKNESTPHKSNTTNPIVWHETTKPVIESKRPLRIERIYRSGLPCGFSSDAWRRILGHYADDNGILTADQQMSILRYAMDRKTLINEREVLGLTVAAQIWRILDATGCLTYELDV